MKLNTTKPLTPLEYYDELYGTHKTSTPQKRQDFKKITAANYEQIIYQYSKLVYRWLWKVKDPHQYMRQHCEEFWQYVWCLRGKFDRERGSLSTWLGWKFRGFWSNKAARAQREYKAIDPLLQLDGVFTGDAETGELDGEGSTFSDSNTAFNNLMHRPESSRWEQFNTEDSLIVDDILSRLPEKDRQIVKALQDGHGRGKGLYELGMTGDPKAREEVNALRKHVKALLEGTAQNAPKQTEDNSNQEYWDTYKKTCQSELPVKTMSRKQLDELPTYQP